MIGPPRSGAAIDGQEDVEGVVLQSVFILVVGGADAALEAELQGGVEHVVDRLASFQAMEVRKVRGHPVAAVKAGEDPPGRGLPAIAAQGLSVPAVIQARVEVVTQDVVVLEPLADRPEMVGQVLPVVPAREGDPPERFAQVVADSGAEVQIDRILVREAAPLVIRVVRAPGEVGCQAGIPLDVAPLHVDLSEVGSVVPVFRLHPRVAVVAAPDARAPVDTAGVGVLHTALGSEVRRIDPREEGTVGEEGIVGPEAGDGRTSEVVRVVGGGGRAGGRRKEGENRECLVSLGHGFSVLCAMS